MLSGFTEKYDVVVVGAGHAGCEAAMAAARMGLKTALYTINLDLIAQMSCNPAVGGIAKGHLVREIDALGGVMGEVIDAVGIQFRLLNTSRGPAVWSPRAQADKKQYRARMRQVLESEPNLRIKQAEVVDLGPRKTPARAPGGPSAAADAALRRRGVRLRDGRRVEAGAVIVTTGTFLNGLIHCGENKYPAGRSGEPPSVMLGEALRRLGFEIGRLKTGTPPRLDARTIDFSNFQVQAGDPDSHAIQFPHPGHYTAADRLLDRLHQRRDASDHSRKRSPRPALLRPDQGHRAALLPLDRRQDREVPGQAPAPDFPRARGHGYERDLRQRHVHLDAHRRADSPW